MAKPTKSQKKRLLAAVEMKAKKLYMCGILNSNDISAIERIITKGYKRLK